MVERQPGDRDERGQHRRQGSDQPPGILPHRRGGVGPGGGQRRLPPGGRRAPDQVIDLLADGPQPQQPGPAGEQHPADQGHERLQQADGPVGLRRGGDRGQLEDADPVQTGCEHRKQTCQQRKQRRPAQRPGQVRIRYDAHPGQ